VTDKEFVLKMNPDLEYNGTKFEVRKDGIYIRGYEDTSELLSLPIPLKYEENFWRTFRKVIDQQMLKKLES